MFNPFFLSIGPNKSCDYCYIVKKISDISFCFNSTENNFHRSLLQFYI